MEFKKAQRKQSKLRLAVYGTSGSGKTYSSLLLAKSLGESIALIDTEFGSANKYADIFNFDSLDLEQPTVQNVCKAIQLARGYDTLIIDSLSHAWKELCAEIDKLAESKYSGNSWRAWSEGTPMQQLLIKTILSFPGHIIVTMRADTNWTTTTNDKGKLQPVRIGEKPNQGKGIEYEFDMLIQIHNNHKGEVLKSRVIDPETKQNRYQDKIVDMDETFAEGLALWLNTGAVAEKSETELKTELINKMKGFGYNPKDFCDFVKQQYGVEFNYDTLKIALEDNTKFNEWALAYDKFLGR